jgi:hypothetical protein
MKSAQTMRSSVHDVAALPSKPSSTGVTWAAGFAQSQSQMRRSQAGVRLIFGW